MSTATDTLLTPAAGVAANDPRYQDIRGELDKLSSATGAPVDWRAVARLAAELTREVGKDLNILAFLALARLQLGDLAGLVAVLRALAQLLRAPPPGTAPEKPRARAGALEWLLTRLRAGAPALPTTPAAAPHLHALHDALRDLADAARETLGDLCPAFSPTLRALDTLRADLPPPTASTPPPSTAPSTPQSIATTPQSTDPSSPQSTTTSQPTATSSPQSAATTSQSTAKSAPQSAATTPQSTDPSAPPAAAAASDAPAPEPPAWRAAVAAYLTPLAGDPSGTDPAGAEAFDDARTEILKLGALSSQAVDWACVEARTDLLLRERSRDLRVAGWFTLARFHRGGLAGLTTGLHLVAAILEEFDLHPRKPRARRDTADWLIRQAAAALATIPPADLREPPLRDLAAAQLHLAAALQTRLDPDVPSLRPLRDALQRALDSAPPPARVQEPVPEDTSQSARPDPRDPPHPAARQSTDSTARESIDSAARESTDSAARQSTDSAARQSTDSAARQSTDSAAVDPRPTAAPLDLPAAPAPPADLARLDHFLDGTGEALQGVARALRERAPTDPRAYRLLRVGVWLGRSAPTPRPDGTTAIPGLADRDRDQLAELHQHARWPGLLALCENLLVRHCFALDLQRLAAAALTGLGRDYAPAGLALRAELRALLTCFPELPALRTSDGLPLADPATQRWLADEVLPRGASAAPTIADDPAFWAELPARLAGPERPAALAEAQAKLDTCPSGQLRFAARLALADACERAGAVPLAALLLAGLTAELERHDLAGWDPPLAARCLAAAARCHRQRGAEADAHAALTRLARLDPAATLA